MQNKCKNMKKGVYIVFGILQKVASSKGAAPRHIRKKIMTDTEFEALLAELAPIRKRHTVFVGSKSVVYYENIEEAEAEVLRLKACGCKNIRIHTTNL